MLKPFYLIFLVSLFINLADSDSRAGEEKAVNLDTIMVVAQKQEQDVQDVPISISVFTATDLEDMRIHSIKDIAPYTPNFMIFNNGTSGFSPPTVRGLTTNVEALSTTVGMYVDGIPVLSGVGFDAILTDIERVEVLKGPQGTLYGKNAEAGVINVISRPPGNELCSSIRVELGEDHKQEFNFNLSSPIVKDQFTVSVAGLAYEKDGFIENSYLGRTANDRQHTYGKIHFRATPTDNLSASAIISRLQYNDGDADMHSNLAYQSRVVESNFQGFNNARSTMGALKINYRFGDLTLESVSTAREYVDKAGGDYDYTSATIFHSDKDSVYEKLSQEFRLSSQGNTLSWVMGVYGDKDDNNVKYEIKGTRPRAEDKSLDGESIGVFAHADWKISQHFSLLSGIRYDYEEKSLVNQDLGIDTQENFNEMSPKFSVQYRMNPDAMFYASASKGYQSGGFNTLAPEGYPLSYGEEKLWSYEIGSKVFFFDRRVRFNTAVYYMDIKDMQVNTSIGTLSAYRSNAAEATSKGVELELDVRVTDTFTVFASLGYNDIEFGSFSDDQGNYEGNVNPFAPDYNYNIGMLYRSPKGIYARCDINGYGTMYFDKQNTYKRDPFDLVNLKIGYESEHWDVYLYADNLFDKNYDSEGYYSGYYTIYSPPRELGITANWRF